MTDSKKIEAELLEKVSGGAKPLFKEEGSESLRRLITVYKYERMFSKERRINN